MYNNNNNSNNFLFQQQMQQMQFQMNNMKLNNSNCVNNNNNNNNNINFGYNYNNNNNNNNMNNNMNNNNYYCMQQQQQQQQQQAQQLYFQQQQQQNNIAQRNRYQQYAQNQQAQKELQQMRQMAMNNINNNNNNNNNNQFYPPQNSQYPQQQLQQGQTGYPYQQQQQQQLLEQQQSDINDDTVSVYSTHSSSHSSSSTSSSSGSSQCTDNSPSPMMIPSPSVTPTPTPTDVSSSSSYSDTESNNNNNNNNYKHRTSSKLRASLRWIIYNDQIDDYADMLCLNDELKIYVINQCSKHSATHSACIKWSKKWNLINHPQCQRAIYYAMSQSKINKKHEEKNKLKAQNQKKSSDIKGFDDLPICTINAVEDVLFVNNSETLKQAKNILSSERKYIGLDLECVVKEFPIKDAPKYCQILQVATSTKCLVFDLQSIPSKYTNNNNNENNNNAKNIKSNTIDPKEFDDALYSIFYNSNILKIGMSFDSDLKLLRKQYPYLKCFKCIIKSYFELEKVLLYLRTIKGQELFNIDMMTENLIKKKLAKTNTKREGGLPTIVRHILKQRLMKKEQLSNWARRPLRISQLQYAAIDAKIELSIYDKLYQEHNSILLNKNKSWVKDLSRY